MAELPVQQHFFVLIKDKLPPSLSLVDEVADLLKISTDSAYRRIRGEKELSFNEIEKLCTHFHCPIDALFNQKVTDQVSFRYNSLNSATFNFQDYLKSVCASMRSIVVNPEREMIYAAKDIPIFYHFLNDEVGAFKSFVWQKTLIGFPEFENKKFLLSDTPDALLRLGKQSLHDYINIPGAELWNVECFHSLFRQIEFYCEAGLFEKPSEALLIVEKTGELISHLHLQAALGKKFLPGDEPPMESNYKMYANEVYLSDNTVLGIMGDRKIAFLTHCALNFLATENEKFCNTTQEWFQNLIKKSSLISSVGEKDRNRFFSQVGAKYEALKENVKHLLRK